MGAHYTRHVEAEQNIIRAFSRIKDGQDKAWTVSRAELETQGTDRKHLPPWPGKASQIKARTWRNW